MQHYRTNLSFLSFYFLFFYLMNKLALKIFNKHSEHAGIVGRHDRFPYAPFCCNNHTGEVRNIVN